jgi:hypothetical protein
MKMRSCKWFIGLVFCVLASCASSPIEGGAVSLDAAIHEAAQNIEARLEGGTIVALLNFSSPTDGFSEYVLEELSEYLVNGGKLIVVDRTKLDLIRQEERFQLSGEVSDESAQSIGKKLGAQVIVSGGISGADKVYRFRVKSLIVESAVVAASSSADISVQDAKVISLLGNPKAEVAAANEGDVLTTTVGAGKGQIFITGYTGSAENVIIPAQIGGLKVTAILDRAFADKGLTSVTIPNSVTVIEQFAFAGNYLTNVTIPNSVTEIGEAAFQQNQLTSVTISNLIKFIAEYAFFGNYLTSVTISNSVNAIMEGAFQQNKLTGVTIPNSVKYIGERAFAENNLTNVTIANSVMNIGDQAFVDNPLSAATKTTLTRRFGARIFDWDF